MASKYTAIIDVIVNKPQLQQQINQASQNAKANVKVSMNKADMDNQVKIWQNKLSSMKIKTPKIFDNADVQNQVSDLQKQIGDWQAGLVPKSNVNAAWSNLNVSMEKTRQGLRNVQKDGYGVQEMMGVAIKKMIMWQAAAELLFGTMQQLKDMTKAVEELNVQMDNIRMVTGVSAEEAQKMMGGYMELAKQLKIPIMDVSKGAEQWIRQGKSQSETVELLTSSLKMGRIAGIEQSESTRIMTAMMRGFNLETSQASTVTDKLIQLDNNYAVTVADLGEGMARTAAVAQLSGVSFDELAAILAVVGSTTQDTIGAAEAFKTVFARMEKIKLGQFFEQGDAVTNINQVEEGLKNLAKIELRDPLTKQIKPLGDVLNELGGKWDTLDKNSQLALANLLGGVHHFNDISTAMGKWGDVQDAMNSELVAGGLTNARYQVALESLTGAQSDFSNAWTEMATATINSGFIKSMYEAGTAVAGFITKAGGLFEFFKKMQTGIPGGSMLSAEMGIKDMQKGLDILMKTVFKVDFSKLKDSFKQSGSNIGMSLLDGMLGFFKQNADLKPIAEQIEKKIKPVLLTALPVLAPAKDNTNKKSAEDTYDYAAALKVLGDALKSDQDIYKDYVDTGNLSIEQLMKLKEKHADYMDLITVEDGKVKLLTDKFKDQAKAQAQSALDTANQNNASEEQIRILQTYVDQLDEEYDALDRLKMVKDAEVEFDRIGKELDQQVKDKEEANKKQDDLDEDLQTNELALLDEQHEARLEQLDSTLDKLDKWKTARERDLELQERESDRSLELAKRASDRSFELRKRGLEKMKEARLKALDATVDKSEDEKKALENAHTAKMRAIEEEEKAQKRAFDEERKALDEQKKAELRALDEEEKARKRALDQKEKDLTKWHDEQSKALESNHDAELKAIEEEQQARDDAYEMEKKNLDDEHERIQDGLKDQLDAYKKIIDAKKNALSNQQNERGYNQNVSAKNQEIGDIQSELAELQFDTSEEAARRRAELQEQLAQKQLELDNLQYDHGIELQQSALDQELADYEEYIAQQQEMDDQHYEAQLAQLENEKKIFDDEMQRREDVLAERLEHDKELLEAEYAARKETLDAEQQALQDSIDARRQSIEDAYDLEKEKIDKADQDYSDSIEKRKQQADDLYNAQKDALDKEVEARKQAVENQKEMIQDSYDAQIQALEDEKQAVDDAFTDRGQREKDYFDAKKQQLKDDYDNYVANVKDKIKLEDEQYKANTKTINDFYDDAKKKRKEDLDDLTENVRLEKVAMADALDLMKGDTQKKYEDMTAAAQGYFDYVKGRIAEQTGQDDQQNELIHNYKQSDYVVSVDGMGQTVYRNKHNGSTIGYEEWSALPAYHSGLNAGFVGGHNPNYKDLHPELQSNEQFAKLMKGELVINPEQMDNFMSNILPNISGGNSTINIENLMPINVAGNLDKSVVNDIDTISQKVTGEIMKIMRDRGMVRNAKLYAL